MIPAVRHFLLVALVIAAAVSPAFARSPDILGFVPAETPYVLVSTEPLPDKLADRIEPAIDNMLSAYQRLLRHMLAGALVEMSDDPDSAEKAARLRGLVNEIIGLMSIEGIRGAGIARDARFALYGNGLLPVLRLQLDDPKAFAATIGRIEAEAGSKMPIATVAGETYRYLDGEKARVILAILDDYLVVTLVPAAFDETELAVALGVEPPRRSIAKSRELRSLAKQYDFTRHFLGFVDVQRVAGSFLGDPTGLNAALFVAAGYDGSAVSDVCRAEFAQLAAVAPRLVIGYTELNSRYLESKLVIEVREDIAAGLQTLPATVPGLGRDPGGLLSIGFSLNPLALRNFYEARLDAMEAEPFECEALAELQAGTAKGRQALAQPIPPVVYGFRGILANITDIEMDLASEQPPTSIDASVLLAIENAQELVTMAAMMDPQVAALNLLPDGKPVALDLPQVSAIAEQAFAALAEGALSLSLGDGAEQDAARMLTADPASPAPFFAMSMDSARYYDMVGKAMMQAGNDEEGTQMSLAMREALRDVVLSSGSLYERMSFDVHFTQRGIEIGGRMTLGN